MHFPLFLALAATVHATGLNVSGWGRSSSLYDTQSTAIESNINIPTYSSELLAETFHNLAASTKVGSNRTLVSTVYPSRWIAMGGEYVDGECLNHTMAEWELNHEINDQEITDAVFHKHWNTWFNQTDVDRLVELKLTSVRIPLGFWIVEGIVDRSSEFYAKGGLDMLISRLEMLKKAGIAVILTHHALPGVAASAQMFAGHCTDDVQFYTDANYRRAITWTAVMTFLTHAHPAFATVFAIEAANEPLQDASLTPGLPTFEARFILAVRAVEAAFGIVCDTGVFTSSYLKTQFLVDGLADAVPLMLVYASTYNLDTTPLAGLAFSPLSNVVGSLATLLADGSESGGECIATTFMDSSWQWAANDSIVVGNPSDYALGPSLYDNHFYLAFGWVAPEATPESYLATICDTSRIISATNVNDAPLFFGEWSLGTEWSNVTTSFLKQFGDAQKRTYNKGAGWIFWAMKMGSDAAAKGDWRGWSYFDAVENGLFTEDPEAYWDENVCDSY